jgi:hypothetical protein
VIWAHVAIFWKEEGNTFLGPLKRVYHYSKSFFRKEDMKMKLLRKIIGIHLVISISIVGLTLPAWAEKKPYKVGCNFEMTGGFANFVAIIKNGLILEQDD